MNLRSSKLQSPLEEKSEYIAAKNIINTLRAEYPAIKDFSEPEKDLIEPLATINVVQNILPNFKRTLASFTREINKLDEDLRATYLLKTLPLLNLNEHINLLSKFSPLLSTLIDSINSTQDEMNEDAFNDIKERIDLVNFKEIETGVNSTLEEANNLLNEAYDAQFTQARLDIINENKEKEQKTISNKKDTFYSSENSNTIFSTKPENETIQLKEIPGFGK